MSAVLDYPPANLAATLDARLGDPADRTGSFSRAHCAELDRSEEFPHAICRHLDALELPSYYIPSSLGGRLNDYEDLLYIWRTLARRDLTVAVVHAKTYLGAVSVWLAGDRDQARRLGSEIMAGRRVSWALTEPDHGSDLFASKVMASPDGSGYRISGKKWLITNASQGSYLCVLTRTDGTDNEHGHSLFLVDRSSLPADSYRLLPKVRTHGIRGADVSGIAFESAPVGRDALVGPPGSGAETVLRGFQLTRTMCTALSLGAGDQALQLATRFATERLKRDRSLIERPHVRDTLARTAALLLTAEATAIVASRCVHALTGEMSVVSAVVKALIPSLVEEMLAELAELLGTQSFLAESYAEGAFQKVQRDHRVVTIFDGSAVVNRNAVINQFPRLTRGYTEGIVDSAGLSQASHVTTPPPPLDTEKLQVLSTDGCSVVQSLPTVVEQVTQAVSRGLAPRDLARAARAVLTATKAVHERMRETRPAVRPMAADYEVAADYELCFAAAACLHLWVANAADHPAAPQPAAELWDDALWLQVVLRELLSRLGHADEGSAWRIASGSPATEPADSLERFVDLLATTGGAVTLFPGRTTGTRAPLLWKETTHAR
ncbi:acyl-CoA dehydrogenase family protein [Salinactinospora qingdaonensis]|uniref:Acyl-CoA dehydrogenase n=1 Tax=Salinactinospora qingdaonensis TaxID=702744 RepID=A0ABP7F9S5_9ACTN